MACVHPRSSSRALARLGVSAEDAGGAAHRAQDMGSLMEGFVRATGAVVDQAQLRWYGCMVRVAALYERLASSAPPSSSASAAASDGAASLVASAERALKAGWAVSKDVEIARASRAEEELVLRSWRKLDIAAHAGLIRLARARGDEAEAAAWLASLSSHVVPAYVHSKHTQLQCCVLSMRTLNRVLLAPVARFTCTPDAWVVDPGFRQLHEEYARRSLHLRFPMVAPPATSHRGTGDAAVVLDRDGMAVDERALVDAEEAYLASAEAAGKAVSSPSSAAAAAGLATRRMCLSDDAIGTSPCSPEFQGRLRAALDRLARLKGALEVLRDVLDLKQRISAAAAASSSTAAPPPDSGPLARDLKRREAHFTRALEETLDDSVARLPAFAGAWRSWPLERVQQLYDSVAGDAHPDDVEAVTGQMGWLTRAVDLARVGHELWLRESEVLQARRECVEQVSETWADEGASDALPLHDELRRELAAAERSAVAMRALQSRLTFLRAAALSFSLDARREEEEGAAQAAAAAHSGNEAAAPQVGLQEDAGAAPPHAATAAGAVSSSLRGDSAAPLHESLECIICKAGLPVDGTLPCGHMFHEACITQWLAVFSQTCPCCKAATAPSDFVGVRALKLSAASGREVQLCSLESFVRGTDAAGGGASVVVPSGPPHPAPPALPSTVPFASNLPARTPDVCNLPLAARSDDHGSKVCAMLRRLRSLPPTDKALVVSTWQPVLDIAARACSANGVRAVALKGAPSERDRAARDFSSLPAVRVLLLNAATDCAGLTLTAASHLFVLDVLLDATVQAQLVGRICRLGQQRQCHVYHMAALDTAEEVLLRAREAQRRAAVAGASMETGEVGRSAPGLSWGALSRSGAAPLHQPQPLRQLHHDQLAAAKGVTLGPAQVHALLAAAAAAAPAAASPQPAAAAAAAGAGPHSPAAVDVGMAPPMQAAQGAT